MGRERFIGTWKLISFELRRPDHEVTYPIGENPMGVIMYDEHGNMSGQIMRRHRPAFASGDHLQGEASEIRAAFEGYMAYCGRYEVNDEDESVSHILECCLFPNWIGTSQKRFFEFSKKRLLLKTPPMLLGGGENIVHALWERIA